MTPTGPSCQMMVRAEKDADDGGSRWRGDGGVWGAHLKGRRGVRLKLLVQELRKATRSETKGAR